MTKGRGLPSTQPIPGYFLIISETVIAILQGICRIQTDLVAGQRGLAHKRQRSQKMQRELSVGVLALRAEKLIVLMLSNREM
ncbi:hypothetical protein K402DRAFT_391317 [Aulographum hederae CBS 113979]|uniref:Uncharacterized protein n=1 Tax=Aulographum hederae CBS 113979 TaxID=1176131 RepID=A0A6G1H812_9PEZI|nr:hypothetical protein K402DRAFT_391317 [Aulographum hederae CBS 113979]